MTLTRDDVIRIRTAKAAARAAGLFVVEKAGKFLLYRECRPRNALVSQAATPAELLRAVVTATTVTPAAAARP